MIKFSIKTLLILLLLQILTILQVKSQTQFILDNEKSIVGMPLFIPNSDTIVVKKFDGTIDTIKKSNVVIENDVKISIITNQMNYINVKNFEILDTTFQFTFRAKDIRLHKDSVEYIKETIIEKEIFSKNIMNRDMLGIGLSYPFGVAISLDRGLNNNKGYRFNLNLSAIPSFCFDYYFNDKIANNIEHNLSFSGGFYFSGNLDYVHGGSGRLGYLLASTYDLKIYYFMLRAGLIFAPTNRVQMLLPTASIGLVFKTDIFKKEY